MKIMLVGFEFESSNKGCEALSYAVMSMLNSIYDLRPLTIVNVNIHDSMGEFEAIYPNVKFINIRMRVKRTSFWKQLKRELKACDAALDITHGDSFSDIYGKSWFAQTTMVKTFLAYSNTPFILMPQTYGPFKAPWAIKWAKNVINHSDKIYTRDMISYEYLKTLGVKKTITNALDLAFALPYVINKEKSQKIRIGLNISGLLWNDCITKAKGFGLTVDYCVYCRRLIELLLVDERYEINLVPHVLCDGREGEDFFENDSKAIRTLIKEFPNCKFPNDFKTALDVKNFIANLDILVAARMHASIAAYSSGVAVIPFAYSRKFEGVYNDLDYPYVINGNKLDTEEAINKTLQYINMKEQLRNDEKVGRERLYRLQVEFMESLRRDILDFSAKII